MLSGAILILAFASSAAVSVVGRFHARARDWLAVVASLVLVGLVACAHGREEEVIYIADFLGTELVLSMTALGWFFAICIVLINAASVVFSLSYMKGKENLTFYYAMMLLVNAGMLGIVLSGDFLSFYIFWEVMSWSTFLLISYRRGPALHAGMKYIVMSIIGSCAMLLGVLGLYNAYNTLTLSELAGQIG